MIRFYLIQFISLPNINTHLLTEGRGRDERFIASNKYTNYVMFNVPFLDYIIITLPKMLSALVESGLFLEL